VVVVVASLTLRGELAGPFPEVYRTTARLADAAGARLHVVGGLSSLRPAPGAPRFVEDRSHAPADFHDEIRAGAALVIEDVPVTPETLDQVFVSPAGGFGSYAPASAVASTASATRSPSSPTAV
jgi:putative NADH-flavin reductase